MNFKCYDVVEIQGKRYVVGESLSLIKQYVMLLMMKIIKKNWVFPKELSLGPNMVLCPLMGPIKNGLPL